MAGTAYEDTERIAKDTLWSNRVINRGSIWRDCGKPPTIEKIVDFQARNFIQAFPE
jgi:hypothetical protein